MDHYVLTLICFLCTCLETCSDFPTPSAPPWSGRFNALWTGSVVCVDLDYWSCPVILIPANNGWVIVKRPVEVIN